MLTSLVKIAVKNILHLGVGLSVTNVTIEFVHLVFQNIKVNIAVVVLNVASVPLVKLKAPKNFNIT